MLKYSGYRKVMEMKVAGVVQRQVVKQTGYTMHSVRKIWDMSEEEFLKISKFSHEQMDEFKSDIMELLNAYPTIRNMIILDRIKEKYPARKYRPAAFIGIW